MRLRKLANYVQDVDARKAANRLNNQIAWKSPGRASKAVDKYQPVLPTCTDLADYQL
jgi:hypothetical protein